LKNIFGLVLFASLFFGCSNTGTTQADTGNTTPLSGSPVVVENAQTGVYTHPSGITVHPPLPAGYKSYSDSTFSIFLLNGTPESFGTSFSKNPTSNTYEQSIAGIPDSLLFILQSNSFQGYRQKLVTVLSSGNRTNYMYHIFFPNAYYFIYGAAADGLWTDARLAAFDQLVLSATYQ
jgi:hypothetical protein